jgi:hypothetical protein
LLKEALAVETRKLARLEDATTALSKLVELLE